MPRRQSEAYQNYTSSANEYEVNDYTLPYGSYNPYPSSGFASFTEDPESYEILPQTDYFGSFDRVDSQMDLSLLSAEKYNEGSSIQQSNASGDLGEDNVQLFGGFMARKSDTPKRKSSSPQSTSKLDMKSRRLTRKESSKSIEEPSSVRQRGRPRLDPRDQTAAERRRTQIRLAQRAYRQRKETTISALSNRVSDLEHTIEAMSQNFLTFNDKAIASGIWKWEPSLAQHLKSTMEHFVDLARNVTSESDVEDDDQQPVQGDPVLRGGEGPAIPTSEPSSDSRNISASPPSTMRHGMKPIAPEVFGITLEESEEDVIEKTKDFQMSDVLDSNWGALSPLQQYRGEVPDPILNTQNILPSLGKSLTPPFTYSFQETSFARRLLRSSLEKLYRMLMNPYASTEEISHMFKFSFCHKNRRYMAYHVREKLLRTNKESLEFWTAPRLHLGGAGLHFPRVTLDVVDQPPPGWEGVQPMGPSQWVEPETPSKIQRLQDLLDETGFGGEWFDANDVEQYLRTKGLYLDGQSSFAEIEVPITPTNEPGVTSVSSPGNSSNGSMGGPQSPTGIDASESIFMQGNEYWNDESLDRSDVNMDFTFEGPDLFDMKALDFNEYTQTAGFINNLAPNNAIAPEAVNPKKKMTVDVDKLTDGLMSGSVCLGRAPGYRRVDVDRELALALQEAF